MSCGKLGGVEFLDLMSIGPLVLASDIQMYEPKPFGYASYLVEKLYEGFLNLRDNKSPNLKFYSLLMHLVLFYGRFKGMCPKELVLNTRNREGEEQPVQLWTSIWNSHYVRSNYIKFEEWIVKPLYRM